MQRVTVETIPFSPDRHGQLQDAGKLSHGQLEEALATLLGKVQALETELTRAREQSGRVQRYYTILNEGQTVIDLALQGVRYTLGINQLLVWGNDVRQYLGVNFTEVDETHVGLTDPASGGERIEILVLPVPFPERLPE